MEIPLLGGRGCPRTTFGPRRGVDTGGDGREDRIEVGHDLGFPTDHQAEPSLETEHPAARADVHVVDARLLQLGGPVDVVPVIGVPAVDDDVARLHAAREVEHGLTGERRRHHHPRGARRRERGDERVEVGRHRRALGGKCVGHRRVDVVDHALVAGPHEPAHEIRPHPAESHHPELHQLLLLPSALGAARRADGHSACAPPAAERVERVVRRRRLMASSAARGTGGSVRRSRNRVRRDRRTAARARSAARAACRAPRPTGRTS